MFTKYFRLELFLLNDFSYFTELRLLLHLKNSVVVISFWDKGLSLNCESIPINDVVKI